MPRTSSLIHGLGALLSFDDKNSAQKMGAASKAAQKLRANFQKIGEGARIAAGGLGQVGLATLPLVGAMGLAAKRSMDWELGMARISTLLAGDDLARLPQLSKDMDQLTRTMGLGAAQTQEAMFQAISASVPFAQATEFMRVAGEGAVGGFTELNVAVDGLTNTLNAYGLGADRARDVSNSFFVANKLGKTTFKELAAEIGKVAPLASVMGVSFREVTSAVAAITKQGIPTGEVMTGLVAIMSNLSRVTDKAATAAAKYKVNFSVAGMQAAGGLFPFLQQLQEKTGGNVEAMGQFFESIEAVKTTLALTGKTGGETFNAAMAEMAAGADITGDAFAKVAATASKRWDRMVATLDSMARKVGDALLPIIVSVFDPIARAISSMTDSLAGPDGFGAAMASVAKDVQAVMDEYVIPYIHQAVEFIMDLGPEAKKSLLMGIAGFTALGAAIMAAAAVLGPLVLAVAGLASVGEGAAMAIGAIFSPSTLVVFGSVAALIAVISDNWDRVTVGFRQFYAGFDDKMGSMMKTTETRFIPALEKVWDLFKKIFETILFDGEASVVSWEKIGHAVGTVADFIVSSMSWAVDAFVFVLDYMYTGIVVPWVGMVKNAIGGIMDIFSGQSILGGVVKLFKALMGALLLPFNFFMHRIVSVTNATIGGAIAFMNKIPGVHMENFAPFQIGLGAAPILQDQLDWIYSTGNGPPPKTPGAAGEGEVEPNTFLQDAASSASGKIGAFAGAVGAAVGQALAAMPAPKVEVKPADVVLDGKKVSKGQGRASARDAARGGSDGADMTPSQRARVLRSGVQVVPLWQRGPTGSLG